MPQNGPAANPYPRGQCTWWAFQRYQALTGKSVPWAADAWGWQQGAQKAGWSTSTTPPKGTPAIVVLQPGVQGAGSLGHVAVVEGVNANGTVTTSGLNWAGNQSTPSTVNFRPGPGVSFVWYTGAKRLPNAPPAIGVGAGQNTPITAPGTPQTGTATGPTQPQGAQTTVNPIGADLATIWQSGLDLLLGGTPGAYISLLQQVHTTLITNPGFYGIALAVDEAEQFPGFVNLMTGPVDPIGYMRSVGATITDNFLPIAIRGGLAGLGVLILGLLIAKVTLGASDKVLPIIETVGKVAA